MFKVIEQEVSVVVNEKPVKQYIHDGRCFIEGKLGSEYSLKLKNNSYNKLLAIVSVDGINVISGDPATDESPGYIINGHSALDVKGFRTSDDSVHAFEFSDKTKSYAANSEQMEKNKSSCGVIGVKFFYEKQNGSSTTWCNSVFNKNTINENDMWDYKPNTFYHDKNLNYKTDTGNFVNATYTYSMCNSLNVKDVNSSLDFDIGTKFSEKTIQHKVKSVDFEKGQVCCFLEVFYASRKVLEEIGVKFDKTPQINFPSSFTSSKYCKAPIKN